VEPHSTKHKRNVISLFGTKHHTVLLAACQKSNEVNTKNMKIQDVFVQPCGYI